MSRGFFDNNKDTDSDELTARCQSLISRLERKLEIKKSAGDPQS